MKYILSGRKIYKDASGIPTRFRTYSSESRAQLAYEYLTGVRAVAVTVRKQKI